MLNITHNKRKVVTFSENKKSTPISESACQTFGFTYESYFRKTRKSCYFLDLSTALAPARRAAGTRNGEQDT